jgi:hypothetical protein
MVIAAITMGKITFLDFLFSTCGISSSDRVVGRPQYLQNRTLSSNFSLQFEQNFPAISHHPHLDGFCKKSTLVFICLNSMNNARRFTAETCQNKRSLMVLGFSGFIIW